MIFATMVWPACCFWAIQEELRAPATSFIRIRAQRSWEHREIRAFSISESRKMNGSAVVCRPVLFSLHSHNSRAWDPLGGVFKNYMLFATITMSVGALLPSMTGNPESGD